MTAEELRRARRVFVARAHPDRGGDPVRFQAGLAHFDALLGQPAGSSRPATPGHPGPAVRVTVVRRPHGLFGWLHHLIERRHAHRSRPSRVR